MTKGRRQIRAVSVAAQEPACGAVKGIKDAEHWKQEGVSTNLHMPFPPSGTERTSLVRLNAFRSAVFKEILSTYL